MLKFSSGVLALALVGCGPGTPTPLPSPSPTPTPVPTPSPVVCVSVPREQGVCHQTTEDVYLSAYEAAVEEARGSGLLYGEEIRDGQAYLAFLIRSLRGAGWCAGIFENEEIEIWSPLDQSFGEQWDAIREPGTGFIYVRRGEGAHRWSCWPASTEFGTP